MDPSTRPNPFDDVREAFSDLRTSEKAAFVFEATFDTLGQALAETGRNVATAIDDLDIESWFRPPPRPEDFAAPPPPPPAPPPPSAPKRPKASKPKAAKKKPTPKPPKTPPPDLA